MKSSINHKLSFDHTPEEVWEYLTSSELMELWLMKNDFRPEVGHQFTFVTKPLPQMNFDGIAYCTVLVLDKPRKLSYSWKGGPGNGVYTLDSVVTWTLVKTATGTELTLDHSGFDSSDSPIFQAMDSGWYKIIRKIADMMNEAKNGNQ